MDAAVRATMGKKILNIELIDDEKIEIIFDDPMFAYRLYLRDNAHYCCEYRWTSCDDQLDQFAGATLLDITVDDVENDRGRGDEGEDIQFLRIHTDRGIIVFQNHNEHNGYYGGFELEMWLAQ